ncbi:hypothetical protein MRX96_018542 [Rhipicephalus microplus]
MRRRSTRRHVCSPGTHARGPPAAGSRTRRGDPRQKHKPSHRPADLRPGNEPCLRPDLVRRGSMSSFGPVSELRRPFPLGLAAGRSSAAAPGPWPGRPPRELTKIYRALHTAAPVIKLRRGEATRRAHVRFLELLLLAVQCGDTLGLFERA